MQYTAYAYQYNAVGNRTQAQETIYYLDFNFQPLIFNTDEIIEVDPPGAPPDEYPGPDDDNFWLPGGEGIDPSSSENPYPEPGAVSSAEETSFLQKAWEFIVSLFTPEVRTASAHSEYSAIAMDGGLSSATVTINYGYDALDRLTSADYSVGDDYVYTYDRVGNRSSQSIGGATTSYQYDAADRLISAGGVSYSWDANGNLLNDGVYTYGYDFADRLSSVSGQGSDWSFGYDGIGNRYQQTFNGQTATYTLDLAGDLAQMLYDGATVYTYGLGRISQQRNDVSEYFLSDALGSVRQLSNQSGEINHGQAFDPFGNSLGWSGRGGSSYGFAGEWTDGSGLQHLRARYYSPGQGRFLTKDPFPGLQYQPSTLNAYAYVTNNPVLMSDPSGEIAPILLIAAGGFVAGALYDAYQQTDGFTDYCDYDVLQTLAWGVGGAAAASSFSIMAISGVGLVGLGLQGTAFGISGLGLTTSISTPLFTAGAAAVGWSSTAMVGLFTSPLSIEKTKLLLEKTATQAVNNVGPGKGHVYGTRVHIEFGRLITNLRRSDLNAEITYRNQQPQVYGTRGAIRVDVVFGNQNNPKAIFDLKTGTATLTPARIQQIQSQLPNSKIKIIEVRP